MTMDGMSELPTWVRDALAGVYDPCCREKGISVLDMGLVRSVRVDDGVAKVELLLTSGWCPFAAGVLTEVKEQILGHPGSPTPTCRSSGMRPGRRTVSPLERGTSCASSPRPRP